MSKENWSQFLLDQGAHMAEGRVLHFADEPATEKRRALNEHIVCDLSHYALIRASGEEAESFLQNQFCNDVRAVSAVKSQLNAYCTPKGRALAFFRLFQRDDQLYLRLPREILEPTLKRLRMFVLMTKAVLEDASDEIMRIGYSGAQADQKLGQLLKEIPQETDAVSQSDGLTIIRIAGQQPRFEIYGDSDSVKSLWEKLVTNASPVGYGSWELLDIQAGVPEILPQTVEAFVPQMINLQAIDALSFKKGCYPGQEIVARMHYLGKIKRRMFLAHAQTDTPPSPGDSLFAPGSTSGQGVGKVVRAQAHPDGGVDLLAVIEISSTTDSQLCLENANGPLMNLVNLPYIIEEPQ